MDLFAQLTRRSRTNDTVFCRRNRRPILDVGRLYRRRLGDRRCRRGSHDGLLEHFWSRVETNRLGCRGRRWCLDLDDKRCGLGRWHLRRGLLGGALRRGGRLFGLDRPDQAVTLRLPANAVGLCFLDRRGVALHADAELDTEIERLFVREA